MEDLDMSEIMHMTSISQKKKTVFITPYPTVPLKFRARETGHSKMLHFEMLHLQTNIFQMVIRHASHSGIWCYEN